MHCPITYVKQILTDAQLEEINRAPWLHFTTIAPPVMKTLTPLQLSEIKKHFIAAGLWASTDANGTPLDDFKKYGKARIPAKTEKKVEDFITGFYALNPEACDACLAIQNTEQFGHDLFLSCAGHGAGWFDRDNLEVDFNGDEIGEVMTKLARSHRCESFDIYRGWVYFQ